MRSPRCSSADGRPALRSFASRRVRQHELAHHDRAHRPGVTCMSKQRVPGLALAAMVLSTATVVAASGAQETYRDPNAPVAERVRDLLSRMTLEEKAAQLCSIWFGKGRLLGPDGS